MVTPTPLKRQRELFEKRERNILKARELRDQGMSQTAIGEKLGISQTNVWKYLRLTGGTAPQKAAS